MISIKYIELYGMDCARGRISRGWQDGWRLAYGKAGMISIKCIESYGMDCARGQIGQGMAGKREGVQTATRAARKKREVEEEKEFVWRGKGGGDRVA